MKSGIGNNYSDLVGYISRSPRGRTTTNHTASKLSPRSVLGNISNGSGHSRKNRLR